MARAVYYDPFGMRLGGYQQGVRDEMTLQDQTRRARGSDWDYTQMAPLRLAAAQRADTLGERAMPYLERQYDIDERRNLAGLYGLEQPQLERAAQIRGNYAAPLANMDMFLAGQYGQAGLYRPAFTQYYDELLRGNPIGQDFTEQNAAMFGLDPRMYQQLLMQQTGAPGPEAELGYDQYLGYDRARQMAMDAASMQQQQWMRQVQEQNAQRGQDYLDIQRGYYGQSLQQPPSGAYYDGSADGF